MTSDMSPEGDLESRNRKLLVDAGLVEGRVPEINLQENIERISKVSQFYPPKDFLLALVDQFLKSPLRFFWANNFTNAQEELVTIRTVKKMMAKTEGIKLSETPQPSSGYMVVLGIGSGDHIMSLVEKLPFRNLVIFEPEPDMVAYSLKTMDWQSIVEALTSRNGHVRIITGKKTGGEASRSIITFMQQLNVAELDGCYIFVAAKHKQISEAEAQFRSAIETMIGGNGHFEDEMNMLRNTLHNGRVHHRKLMHDARPVRTVRQVPVIIIGGGPSVGKHVRQLRELAKISVVISCGSSIRFLMKNNIVPDFHCELERGHYVYDSLQHSSKTYDLSDITLIANNAVDPKISTLFKDTIYHFREAVGISRLLAREEEMLALTNPTVANIAVRASLSFGFKEIYLFGVDLATRQEEVTHVKGLDDNPFDPKNKDSYPMPVKIKGARGGFVYTGWVFLYAVTVFEKLISLFPKTKVFNCSDGLAIAGTALIDPSSLDFDTSAQDKADDLQALLSELPQETGAELAQRFDEEAFTKAVSTLFNKLEDLFREASHLRYDEFYRRVLAIVPIGKAENHTGMDVAVYAIFRGSLDTIFQYCYYMIRRLEDDKDHAVFMEYLSETLIEECQLMRQIFSETMAASHDLKIMGE